MKFKLSQKEFEFINEIIESKVGIYLTDEKAYLIESRLSKIIANSGMSSFEEYCNKLLRKSSKENEITKIIDAITTNETYWFRDKTPWTIMEKIVIPNLVEALRNNTRAQVNIWSAACSTGQEPYSIAMLIDNYIDSSGIKDVGLRNFRIIASDISTEALEIAKAGIYDNIATSRGLGNEFKNKYFKPYERGFQISERIKSAVDFKTFNLKDSFFEAGVYDVVFCRYVLIYFKDILKNKVLENLQKTLKPNGILMLGSSEIFSDYNRYFNQNEYMGGIYYSLKKK
jgi:chemotaxis protein methyltransferase CheR